VTSTRDLFCDRRRLWAGGYGETDLLGDIRTTEEGAAGCGKRADEHELPDAWIQITKIKDSTLVSVPVRADADGSEDQRFVRIFTMQACWIPP
jgi:hypothetical protein